MRGVGSLGPWLLVLAILALAAGLRFSRIDEYHNSYYTAAASSMFQSPSNFLFGSFDPGGVVMVDKPPAAFWPQAAAAALFGVSPWAVNLPQAIMGTLIVLLLYLALAPSFGHLAAAAGALCLAVVPAAVLVDSRNEPDTMVMFALTLAALCLIRAVRTSRTRWLVASATLVGIAFNAKMAVALVPLPAFLAYYVLAARGSWPRVALKVALMLTVTAAVSLIWVTIVALTPAESRPYVGSTPDNSIWTLVFQYNGLDRFTGFAGPARGEADSGVLGLLDNPLAGQLGWLLPLGLIALLVGAGRLFAGGFTGRPAELLARIRGSPALAETVLWAGWLVTGAVVFGLAQATTWHVYYLVGLAAPLAALVGIGLSRLWDGFRGGGVAAVALPVALGGAAAYQACFSQGYVGEWATTLLAVTVGVGALIMLVGVWSRSTATPPAASAAGLAAAVLIVVPVAYGASLGGRIAGPSGVTQTAAQAGFAAAATAARIAPPVGVPQGGVPPPRAQPREPWWRAISSLIAQQGDAGTRFTVATVNANQAADFIIEGVPAVAIGGFSGRDRIFTVRSFRGLAERGELHYFLVAPGEAGATAVTAPAGGEARAPMPRQPQGQFLILVYVRAEWEDVSVAAGLPPGTLFRYPGAGPSE